MIHAFQILLSKSCEKINNNFPGSSRWASVANFPSLDMNTMKSATSQESVISVMSTCTNIGQQQQQFDMSEWQQQQQAIDDGLPYTVSMPSTPPVPNFDLSHNNGYHESSPPILTNNYCGLQAKINASGEFSGYASLNSSTGANNESQFMTQSQAAAAAANEEAQKSVAELIMTFGGRVSKKLDLKNKFEPILEVEGSEEQPMSLGDCSDNNSTSGVSSIIPTSINGKDLKSNDQHGKNLDNLATTSSLQTNGKNMLLSTSNSKMDTGQSETGSANSSRRNSKTTQQIQDEIKASERRYNRSSDGGSSYYRRGSASPPKTADGTTLKSILKKPKQPDQSTTTNSSRSGEHQFPNPSTSRRGSVPGNCTRLYEQHTISSSAKVPKRSILKNGNVAHSPDNSKQVKSSTIQASKSSASSDRSASRSPENNPGKQPSVKEDSPPHESKSENLSQSPITTTTIHSSSSQTRQNRPTSILLTSNADNKIGSVESPVKGKSPNEYSTFIVSSDQEKDEKTIEKEKAKQQSRKRFEQLSCESNRFQQQQNIQSPLEIPTTASVSAATGDGTEPAAVAIKVFPPDPIIIPKSSVLLLNTSKAPDSPTAEENPPIHPEFKEYMKRNAVHTSTASSTTTTTTTAYKQVRERGQDGTKSQWRAGTGCTGSVDRAKERFESVRSKLRRGSVPDF